MYQTELLEVLQKQLFLYHVPGRQPQKKTLIMIDDNWSIG